MITLTRRYRFSASHRLHSPALSAEENAELYGKCNHPFGHGHNYILEVTVEGNANERTGLLIAVKQLDQLVEERVLQLFASRYINVDVPQFAELVPTTENIAAVIAEILGEAWEKLSEASEHSAGSKLALRRVYIRETARNSFEIVLARPCQSEVEGVLVNAESKVI